MKRKWKRPELVVLFKGRPEENVLEHCKSGPGTVGPSMEVGNCKWKVGDVCAANCEIAPTS